MPNKLWGDTCLFLAVDIYTPPDLETAVRCGKDVYSAVAHRIMPINCLLKIAKKETKDGT